MKININIILVSLVLVTGCSGNNNDIAGTLYAADYYNHTHVPIDCGVFGFAFKDRIDTVFINNTDMIDEIIRIKDSLVIHGDISNYINVRYVLEIPKYDNGIDTLCIGGNRDVYYKGVVYSDTILSIMMGNCYDQNIR